MDQLVTGWNRKLTTLVVTLGALGWLTACPGEGNQQQADAGTNAGQDADASANNSSPDSSTADNQQANQQTNQSSNHSDDAGQNNQNDPNADNQTEETNQVDNAADPEAPTAELAADGQALMPIVIGPNASPAIEEAAQELADYLAQITGAQFSVTDAGDAIGIFIGRNDDFAAPPLADVSFGDGTFEREEYVLRSSDDALYVLGATPLAVRFAVWDLLYRLGHRQFFPTDTWEVVPAIDELTVAVDVREAPDYYNRQAPRGAMRMDVRPWGEAAWERWQLRNRTTPTFELNTSHAYDAVIDANQAAFDNNPDYFGLVDGQRRASAQPNVAHPEVQQMFIDHALGRLANDPGRDSVAMDPLDGNLWSTSPESLAIGGPSEQAVHLANLVAEAVVSEYGDDKYVGMYGYSHHSPPPAIDVHPNVIISLATAFIRGGYTFEEMIDGWSARANMIGIREYYGLWEWHYSLPGPGARAANTEYIADTIAHFHSRGARFMNAESNDTWGAYGLGYYLAARMMWDVDEASQRQMLIDDFIDKAFGPAAAPMAKFYELIDGNNTDPYAPARERQLNDDMVGRMYRLLADARDLAQGHDDVQARIEDLILYTHYVELYRRFDQIEGPQRQQAFDDLMQFVWRSRGTMMTESVEIVRNIDYQVRTDDNLSWGSGRTTNRPANHHRVDENLPFSQDEVDTILSQGIANHDLLDFDMEPWSDSGALMPAGFASDEAGDTTNGIHRGDVQAVLATDDGILPRITLSAGHIYDDRGPVRWELRDLDGTLIDSGGSDPDEVTRTFDLEAPAGGQYRFSITNTGQGFRWSYDSRGAKMTLLAGGEHFMERNWYSRLYFYVPAGTDTVYLAGTLLPGRHDFIDGDGQEIDHDTIDVIQGYTVVPVPDGQDGSVWALDLRSVRPGIRFLNTPGYVALSPDELLLPQEVVDDLP